MMKRKTGHIAANLRLGADVSSAVPLVANRDLSCPGVKLHGSGFIVDHETAEKLGLGRIPGAEKVIRDYRNGTPR